MHVRAKSTGGREDPSRSPDRREPEEEETEEEVEEEEAREDWRVPRPDKSGLSGHLLSFVLPAIFCHPFALLFSAWKRPQSILVGTTLYRATSPHQRRTEEERKRERERTKTGREEPDEGVRRTEGGRRIQGGRIVRREQEEREARKNVLNRRLELFLR